MTKDSANLPRISEMIARAKENPELLGELLESYRSFLLLSLRPQIGPKLRVRSSESDIVQQTCEDAWQAFAGFAGTTEPEFSAWLKKINENNLKDAIDKHINNEIRPVDKERRLTDTDSSASVCWKEPAAAQSTPSQRILRGEKALRLAEAIESLPEMQREAVRLRHLEDCSLQEIAERLDRSLPATAGLVKRGLQGMRKTMSEKSWG